MRAGDLREPISIIAEQRTEDDLGGQVVAWATQFDSWANVAPVRGAEKMEAQQVQSTQTYRITIRYRPNVTTAMRVNWSGKTMNILAVNNPDQRRKYLEMICEEGVV